MKLQYIQEQLRREEEEKIFTSEDLLEEHEAQHQEQFGTYGNKNDDDIFFAEGSY